MDIGVGLRRNAKRNVKDSGKSIIQWKWNIANGYYRSKNVCGGETSSVQRLMIGFFRLPRHHSSCCADQQA